MNSIFRLLNLLTFVTCGVTKVTLVGILLALVLACLRGEGAEPSKASHKSPADVSVIALDVSGSMEGEPLRLMTAGAVSVLAALPDGAFVSLVIFHHRPTVLSPPVRLNKETRRKLITLLSNLVAEGGTDIILGGQKSLEQAPDGSTVTLLSDGTQTGQGSIPVLESVWGPALRDLTREARARRVTFHTLGLGPDADAVLLGRLAAETGGKYWPIRRPSDIRNEFVALASYLAKFWRRSLSGDFSVAAAEEPVVCLSETAPGEPQHTLFRLLDDSRLVPVDPVFDIRQGGIRACRYVLLRGEYRFVADPRGKQTDLLRPMAFAWHLPDGKKLPANRLSPLVVRTKATGTGAVFNGLQLNAALRWDGDAKTAEKQTAAINADGRFSFPMRMPRQAGRRLTAVFEAKQHVWSYHVGTLTAETTLPEPIDAKVEVQKPHSVPLTLSSIGSENETTLHITLTGLQPEASLKLVISPSTNKVEVRPAVIVLDRSSMAVPVRLTRKVTGKRVTLNGNLRLTITGDVVPTRINGQTELNWPFVWSQLEPGLYLEGLPSNDKPLQLRRNSALFVPVRLAGVDLAGLGLSQSPGLRLDNSQLPPGFHIDWLDQSTDTVLPLLQPEATRQPALRIRAAGALLPGQYSLSFTVWSTNSKVPVNSAASLVIDLKATIGPIEVEVSGVDDNGPWTLLAPTEDQCRDITLLVQATDKGSLPPVKVASRVSSGSIQVVDRGQTWHGGTRLQAAYRVLVPAQTKPGTFKVLFSVEGLGVVGRPKEMVIEVPPIVVQVRPVMHVPRYAGCLDCLLPWLWPHGPARVTVRSVGPWKEAHCSWTLIAVANSVEKTTRPITDEEALLPVTRSATDELPEFVVELNSPYEPTVFQPGRRVPMQVEESEVAVPLLAVALAATVGPFLVLFLLPPWPVRVRIAPGDRVRWRLRAIRLHREVPVAGLKLSLKRNLLGMVKVYRGRRDCSTARVFIEGKGELTAGQSERVRHGDVIAIDTADGLAYRIVVLSGREVLSGQETLLGELADTDSAISFNDRNSSIETPVPLRHDNHLPDWLK